MTRVQTLLLALCALPMSLVGGCNEDGVDPNRLAQLLDITSFRASPSPAVPGQQVTVSWRYANATQLRRQSLSFLGLALAEPEQRTLTRTQRTLTFQFEGTVTVRLSAIDRTGHELNAVIDVTLDQQGREFKLKQVASVDPRNREFPRLGQRTIGFTEFEGQRTVLHDPAPIDIVFTEAFGIYEVGHVNQSGQRVEDGRIDYLHRPELADFFQSGESFFARSNSARESEQYRFTIGAEFPFLDAGFLATADGQQFFGIAHGDAVACGLRIAYDGDERTDPRTRAVFRKNATYFNRIFACVDLRSEPNGRYHVADLHVGNIEQGLVLSVFHGFVPFETRHVGTVSGPTVFNTPGPIDTISGSIKGPRLGFPVSVGPGEGEPLVTNLGGVPVPAVLLDVATVEWNVFFHPDTDLSEVVH